MFGLELIPVLKGYLYRKM